MKGFLIAVSLILVAGCASGPVSQATLSPADRPAPALAEVGVPKASEIATERIVVEAAALRDGGVDEMVRTLSRFVAPGTWGPESGTALYADGDAIVVRHSAAAREAVRTALRAMTGAARRTLTVTARYFEMEPEMLVELEAAAAAEGGLADVYDGDALRAVVAGWLKQEGVNVLTAPKLTVFAGQLGTITIANQVAYIRGYEKQAAGSAVVWDPVIGTISSGIAFEFAAIPNGAGSADTLVRFSLDMSELYEAQDSFLVLRQGGALASRNTELPRVLDTRIAATLSLRPGQAILAIGAEPPAAAGRSRLLIVVIEIEWQN
ncbi:MAG: hypothetical protein FD180_2332 [Planctomycetota bacterium]|nr:MAG: hypothetical protein FD180_2332 [Planctomycetota bacterium]